MSFENPYIQPTPASEVIAEKKLRALSQSNADVLASVSEQLADVPDLDSSEADPVSVILQERSLGQLPYEMQTGDPRYQAQHKARPPLPPGIPNPDVSPAASHPQPPLKTL